MAPLLAPFADIEDVVMALLATVAPTVTIPPPNFTPPLVQVSRVGGVDDGLTDRPLVYVACYGRTYPLTKTMAEQCRQIILASAGTSVPLTGYPHGVCIDAATTVAPPAELPSDNAEMRRKTASYRLELRRPYLG
jgi:hypothetical protein